MKEVRGKEALRELAETYQQVYIDPCSQGSEEAYRRIVNNGEEPEKRSLAHFITDDRDRLTVEKTPAGEVWAITLYERKDFETLLRILANRCRPVEIPKTQGASMLKGVINWRRIEARQREFITEELAKGNPKPDWDSEFDRFISDPKNFKDAFIILSTGPYSGIPAERMGLSEDEWILRSDTIRRTHECTHFICRTLFPKEIDPVWDELVADAAGVFAAFGEYDPGMLRIFLGIEAAGFHGEARYTGGRLENYLGEEETVLRVGPVSKEVRSDLSREEKLDLLSTEVQTVLESFCKIAEEARRKGEGPYDLALLLQKQHEAL